MGANDTVTSSRELKIGTKYVDDDTRLISLKNPKTNLTEQQVKSVFSDVTVTKVLVGDKNGADFDSLYTAYIEEKSDRNLDLS